MDFFRKMLFGKTLVEIAAALTEALPYIRGFAPVLIRLIPGNAPVTVFLKQNPTQLAAALEDLLALAAKYPGLFQAISETVTPEPKS